MKKDKERIHKQIYPVEAWNVTEMSFERENNYRNETTFALSNGYIGTRGTLEEGYGFSIEEGLEGNYVNGFYESEEIDPLVILDNYKTYYHFLQSVDKDVCKEILSEREILTLEYISRVVARGKRPHEVEILSEIIERGQANKNFIISRIEREYNQKISEREIESAISNLRGEFVSKEDERKKYVQIEIIQSMSTGMIRRMQSFYER